MLKRAIFVIFAVALVFLVLTMSIGLPIYLRPFYYAHIDALELDAYSGFTKDQIRTAYDEVLDYLTIPGRPFGTGELAHSTEGAAHFADCKVLFDLNAVVLLGSAVVVIVILLLRKRCRLPSLRPAAFWAGVSALTLPVVVGGLAALDFDRAFVIFHQIFFPGKDNWIFDYYADPIIRVLPQVFFMNCAILIGAGLILFSCALLWLGRKRK
jgi:integral membrane protein (TIGR01906 family)